MKLADHVEEIRLLIHKSFDNQFSRLGLSTTKALDAFKLPSNLVSKRKKLDVLVSSHKDDLGSYEEAREKALEELTFTLFNRFAAVKVMESLKLFPPILTKEAEHGGRSFGHQIWLEKHPEMRNEELEGIRQYLKEEFNILGESIPLYHKSYPYALLPNVIELNEIIEAFNAVEQDAQIEDDIWESDDILGWLYESYNNSKKKAHKESGAKTEYDKVSLQSQVYTPRWVVEFLVQNSLGKMYLEMYPDSDIKDNFKIANAPESRVREPKPLHEVKLIDPAAGSGNFLLYAFEFFYKLYEDQIDDYGADYEEDEIPKLIIENNLHGIDLDDRAIQLAQLGLWIKAQQKKRNLESLNFNVVSSDFHLVDFEFVYPILKGDAQLDSRQLEVAESIWKDLQNAYKFGSLIRLNEKIDAHLIAVKSSSGKMFSEEEEARQKEFKSNFLKNLEKAFLQFASQQGNAFLTDKTKDAVTFLKLITQSYDIATANPPYTDSSDFGPDLKKFIESNYKKPYKFNTNLFAAFIKRSFELTKKEGKVAMVHPPTFMYIKTFEDVRKFILEKSHIDLFVEWGYLGMFNSSARVDSAMYVLDKRLKENKSTFIKLNNIYEGVRYEAFVEAYDKLIKGDDFTNNYSIPQTKLKIITSWPFIYWISDDFREKFKSKSINELLKVRQGIATGNNNRCLRFWWEVDQSEISTKRSDEKKWVGYSKGGPYQKWYGNLWLVVDFSKEGYDYLLNHGNHLPSKEYYFLKGLTYSASGSKGASFRYLPENNVFDVGGSCIFPFIYKNIDYSIAFMNSKLCFYITSCLNPTVNTQVGDLKRVPFVIPEKRLEKLVTALSKRNINIVEYLKSLFVYERNFMGSPINSSTEFQEFKKSISIYFNADNWLKTQILINEAIINERIFDVYELTKLDKEMVLTKEGQSIGALPVSVNAKNAYLKNEIEGFTLENIRDYIESLSEKEFDANEKDVIESEFPQLYQSNNDLEEFCIRHQVNPINVWYWFKESNVIPKQRMNDLAMEFLADMIREILMEDEDGIIPLVPNAGEKVLLDRIEEKFIEKGFPMAQYSSFDSVLGRDLNSYINSYFFKDLSDHLNLFMYLPKAPFIWHLTSGPEQGFDCYLIIYKWNRDKLLSIRSRYIEQRERALENRQSDLKAKETPTASEQNELEKIYKQLKEIENFKSKIDELLEEGYDAVLDDGVGKNIAPLQKKKMLAYDVLNAGQLKKYLNADW
ncbi:BREX-1 system adenine-specific DNA-methyltransferase PglX [Salegentibacter maritimus]|uniref:site-specific DNA-methyltransferase (adenine-specific) n=1 Tax=Salegentibacter maritimus TaxID=2794347 RepID=A0ABS0TIZ7_9FLAO|nr:BREX-1 system adenine-specific DNA-methyltransferase PglX [Salegentibacter maritimus]MBI6121034.1 BREX-1 system adenine-specific DNA-methyltransferase PglX [Salegentibacter maritimus]